MLNYYKKPSAEQPRNSLGTPKANWMSKTASGPQQQAATQRPTFAVGDKFRNAYGTDRVVRSVDQDGGLLTYGVPGSPGEHSNLNSEGVYKYKNDNPADYARHIPTLSGISDLVEKERAGTPLPHGDFKPGDKFENRGGSPRVVRSADPNGGLLTYSSPGSPDEYSNLDRDGQFRLKRTHPADLKERLPTISSASASHTAPPPPAPSPLAIRDQLGAVASEQRAAIAGIKTPPAPPIQGAAPDSAPRAPAIQDRSGATPPAPPIQTPIAQQSQAALASPSPTVPAGALASLSPTVPAAAFAPNPPAAPAAISPTAEDVWQNAAAGLRSLAPKSSKLPASGMYKPEDLQGPVVQTAEEAAEIEKQRDLYKNRSDAVGAVRDAMPGIRAASQTNPASPQYNTYDGPVRPGMPAGTPAGKNVSDGDAVRGSQQRLTDAHGNSLQERTADLNASADSVAATREAAMARVKDPSKVPYGARSAYSPLEGEGELRAQQAMTSGVTSQEELLASNKAQVDGMRAKRAETDSAAMSRSDNPVADPKAMRSQVEDATSSYNQYKRKGGGMGFRDWASGAAYSGKIGEEAKKQFAHNYPGIFDGEGGRELADKIDEVADVKDTKTKDRLASRRAGLLKLQDSQSARVANAVAHGQNPNQAWATMQNQGRQDEILQQQRIGQQDYYNAQANIAAAAHPGRNFEPQTPFEQMQEADAMASMAAKYNPSDTYKQTFLGLDPSMPRSERHRIATEAADETRRRAEAIAKTNPAMSLYMPPSGTLPDYSTGVIPGTPSTATTDPNKAEEMRPKPATPEELAALHQTMPAGSTKEQMEEELKKSNKTLPPEPEDSGWWTGGEYGGNWVSPEELQRRAESYRAIYGKEPPKKAPTQPVNPGNTQRNRAAG